MINFSVVDSQLCVLLMVIVVFRIAANFFEGRQKSNGFSLLLIVIATRIFCINNDVSLLINGNHIESKVLMIAIAISLTMMFYEYVSKSKKARVKASNTNLESYHS